MRGGRDRREVLALRAQDLPPVQLLFWSADGTWFVIAEDRTSKWAARALAGEGIELRPPGGPGTTMFADEVRDPEERAVVRRGFESKYGSQVWPRYFASTPTIFRFTTARPSGRTEIDRIREEFDLAAPEYERRVTQDAVDRELRIRSVEWLRATLRGRDPLLEIGCGVGLETIPLLREGHRIVSIDVSPGMLSEVRRRVRASGFEAQWTGIEGGLHALRDATGRFPPGHFAGAFSTFGAFNLVVDLSAPCQELHRLLPRDAPLAIASLNASAPSSLAYGAAQGRIDELRARLQTPLRPGGTRYALTSYSRPPGRLARELVGGFTLFAVRPATVLLPPSAMPRVEHWLGDRGARRVLELDRRLSRVRGLASLGEWSFAEFRSRG